MSKQTCIRDIDHDCDCTSCQQRRVIEGLIEELRKLREWEKEWVPVCWLAERLEYLLDNATSVDEGDRAALKRLKTLLNKKEI